VMSLELDDRQPFEEFLFFGVTARLCDAPIQVLFGAEDWRYCVLSLLGSWLELYYLLNPEPNKNLFGAFGLTSPLAIKSSARYHLCKLFKDELLGKLGFHSNRKHGVTTAHRSSCSKDEVNFCGRWKNSCHQQDT
jgi:hypothetical protein